MLVKEYRIMLPLTVQEYQIAQLYMIQKKSRVDTSGAGSGVEIIKNEPYEDGPGGQGQYTHKVYHIGSHLPAWFRSILPRSALTVEEEAWNAYPYTKTRYTCPFVERLLLEVETMYFNDNGTQENVFNLSKAELHDRVVDVMDIVKDAISVTDYCKEEDPKLYKSMKTGRGPLGDDWVEDCYATGKPLMCAYKVCRVEFRYWGMQSRIEKFIHDIALRKTMLRAHRQAWSWQDEWFGLTIQDIRILEGETQRLLQEKMTKALEAEGLPPSIMIEEADENNENDQYINNALNTVESNASINTQLNNADQRRKSYATDIHRSASISLSTNINNYRLEGIRSDSEDSETEFFDAYEHFGDDEKSQRQQNSMVRWNSVEMLQTEEDYQNSTPSDPVDQSFFGNQSMNLGSASCATNLLILVFHGGSVFDGATPLQFHSSNEQVNVPPLTPNSDRGRGLMHSTSGNTSKSGDMQTLRTTLDAVISAHYPHLAGRIAVRLVSCPPLCSDAMNLMATLSPYGGEDTTLQCEFMTYPSILPLLACISPHFQDAVTASIHRANTVYHEFINSEEGNLFNGEIFVLGDAMGGLMAYDALSRLSKLDTCRKVGRTHSQISAKSDCSAVTIPEDDENIDNTSMCDFQVESTPPLSKTHIGGHRPVVRNRSTGADILPREDMLGSSCPATILKRRDCNRMFSLPPVCDDNASLRMRSNSLDNSPISPPPSSTGAFARSRTNSRGNNSLNFEVSELFLLGSPLALLLAQRKMQNSIFNSADYPTPPACRHAYNLFYATDPCSFRVEPLLYTNFAHVTPLNVPRYNRFPLGDRQSTHLFDNIRKYLRTLNVRLSIDNPEADPAWQAFQLISNRWWGGKRIDYALYCPEALGSFPPSALPSLLHASFWESQDLIAFLLRQFASEDFNAISADSANLHAAQNVDRGPSFVPIGPTEKWKNRRTIIKRRNNLAANHRANDVIVADGKPQALVGRFMYGPLDVVALGGETVDIYVGPDQATTDCEWKLLGTETTDSHGRLTFNVPNDALLSQGVHPVKMVVRGDHTYLDMFVAILPPVCHCVVFSIDGSFAASMSVSAKDPKVRPGAVDVVRLWQDLGYLILYVTARPDMQQRRVVSWLSQHNFPSGLIFFSDGISKDPLKQKTAFLKHAVSECSAVIEAGYGSAKDVHVYASIAMPPERIFVVGKCPKKLCTQATHLIDGYAQHLLMLQSGELQSIARPATGNGRMIIRKACFSNPGQSKGGIAVQRSHSFTPRTGKYGGQLDTHKSSPHLLPNVLSVPAGETLTPPLQGLEPASSPTETKTRGMSPMRLVRRVSWKRKSAAEKEKE